MHSLLEVWTLDIYTLKGYTWLMEIIHMLSRSPTNTQTGHFEHWKDGKSVFILNKDLVRVEKEKKIWQLITYDKKTFVEHAEISLAW